MRVPGAEAPRALLPVSATHPHRGLHSGDPARAPHPAPSVPLPAGPAVPQPAHPFHVRSEPHFFPLLSPSLASFLNFRQFYSQHYS